jgi:peptide/nickel transport system substrate-binding protein
MYSDAGKEFYNQANPERARQLAKEAGYKGQTIRWLTTQTYPAYYTTALVGKQQLEAAGFKVELVVVDWATLVTMRSDPKAYELFSTAFGTTWDPVLGLMLSPTWPAAAVASQDPEMIRLLNEMRRESDPAVRKQLWGQAQAIFWDDVPVIKFGDYFNLHIHRPDLQGYQGMQTSFFWNVSLVKK